jgi:hypothetical protein
MAVRTAEPAETLLAGAQFSDAYGVRVADAGIDARQAAVRLLGSSPGWVSALMRMRNAAVAPFGLKRPGWTRANAARSIGIFPVVSESPERIVLGFDDKHLDFRIVVDVVTVDGGRRVRLTTVVRTHNALGRVYLAAVLPFHRVIVRALLRRLGRQAAAGTRGSPTTTPARSASSS